MTPVRVVLDSNVYISAFLFGGNPRMIIASILEGVLSCSVSLGILDEIRDVLQRPKFGLTSDQALSFIEELHTMCHLVTPKKHFNVITADPDDNVVLDCAHEAKANYIISGDTHLLNLKKWKGILILSPADFVSSHLGQQGA